MVSSILITDAWNNADIDITNLIFWNISFADDVRAIKVDPTLRLSYLRNHMGSSILILDAVMLHISISRI